MRFRANQRMLVRRIHTDALGRSVYALAASHTRLALELYPLQIGSGADATVLLQGQHGLPTSAVAASTTAASIGESPAFIVPPACHFYFAPPASSATPGALAASTDASMISSGVTGKCGDMEGV